MAEKKINPILKLALELGPILAFFIGYGKLKDQTFTIAGTDYSGFIVMTALFIPADAGHHRGALGADRKTVEDAGWQRVVLVVVFGGLSVWLNDERFFKMKPTMIYLLFGGVLGFGLLRGKSYLRAVMDEALANATRGLDDPDPPHHRLLLWPCRGQ